MTNGAGGGKKLTKRYGKKWLILTVEGGHQSVLQGCVLFNIEQKKTNLEEGTKSKAILMIISYTGLYRIEPNTKSCRKALQDGLNKI